MRTRAHWWCYHVTVTTPDGQWHRQTSDPTEAIDLARFQMLTHGCGDDFTSHAGLTRLQQGLPLEAVCGDGSVITVKSHLT